ncbi:MAG TPA: ABC transporter permease [Verrucomicrobiales bacterium]|nr:ABC transporter permease [Verrucomicrobiales bacterium]
MIGARQSAIFRTVFNGYLILFFAYMFLPLIFMSVAAFNAASSPSAYPWQGFTLEWFDRLFEDSQMGWAIVNSTVISLGTVVLAVPLGLAGALLLTQLSARTRSTFYALMVSPILIPGTILGISTLILWDGVGLHGGLVLSVIGQTTYVASYCMLLILARLQRFDYSHAEAALDLGAPQHAVFTAIILPFLRPALLTAGILAFLQSFESYNTALFTIGNKTTFTVFIASRVRLGLNPTINAVGVIMVVATILLAVLYEINRRRATKRRPSFAARVTAASTATASA